MKRYWISCVLLCCMIHARAQYDTLYRRHSIGLDMLSLSNAFYAPTYAAQSYNIDVFYRYRMAFSWGINLGAAAAYTESGRQYRTLDNVTGTGVGARLGLVWFYDKWRRGKENMFSVGINGVASIMQEKVQYAIPSTSWDHYTDVYTIQRMRYGGEIELSAEERIYGRLAARVTLKGGFALRKLGTDGLHGFNYPGIYNWIGTGDIYFFPQVFLFYKI